MIKTWEETQNIFQTKAPHTKKNSNFAGIKKLLRLKNKIKNTQFKINIV